MEALMVKEGLKKLKGFFNGARRSNTWLKNKRRKLWLSRPAKWDYIMQLSANGLKMEILWNLETLRS